MSVQQQELWVVQEFKLTCDLMQQVLGAFQKNRLKRAEKLIQEAVKVAQRLKNWQTSLPSDQCNSEIALAISELHKSVMERQDWFEQARKSNILAAQKTP